MTSTTLATKEIINTKETVKPVDIEECQVKYICEAFELAKRFDGNFPNGMEPLIIKNNNTRISCGVCELVELRGFFTKQTVEKAIFILRDTGAMMTETITEFITNETGMVTTIRFMSPRVRTMFA